MEKLKDIAPLYFQEESSSIFMMDCVSAMKNYPDNYFDLAVVDPPYGIDWMNQVKNPNIGKNWKQYDDKDWDKNIPDQDYFNQLFRTSKNQIIWGGNYMIEHLSSTPCIIIWDKMQEFSGATFEMAWTSFSSPSKSFRMSRVQAYVNMNKIHPTQKPVALYDWIFKNYAETGMKVLDTHLGSGSSRIAAHKAGMDFTGFEIDEDYFRASNKRFKDYHSQLTLFSHVS
jgi:site-specific DNA-methyltransferase (adenine-specific)